MNKKIAAAPVKEIALAIAAVVALAPGAAVWAADSDSHFVSFTIAAINEIDVATAPVNLTVNTAVAGSQPNSVSAPSSYSITTNAAADSKKISARLDTAMPANVTLQVNVTAPSAGSTSAGAVTLTATDVEVVGSIEGVVASGVGINYTLSATVAAAPTAGSKEVFYTIADDT